MGKIGLSPRRLLFPSCVKGKVNSELFYFLMLNYLMYAHMKLKLLRTQVNGKKVQYICRWYAATFILLDMWISFEPMVNRLFSVQLCWRQSLTSWVHYCPLSGAERHSCLTTRPPADVVGLSQACAVLFKREPSKNYTWTLSTYCAMNRVSLDIKINESCKVFLQMLFLLKKYTPMCPVVITSMVIRNRY